MPGADHAGVTPSLTRRPWCSGPPRWEHWSESTNTVRPGPHREQAEVAELASGGPPLRQLGQRAEILPADRGQVPDRFGVARSGPEPHRQVTAEIAADGGGGEPACRQRDAAAAPPGLPGEQRAGEQQGRAGLGDRVHQPDPLLMECAAPTSRPGRWRRREAPPPRPPRSAWPTPARPRAPPGPRPRPPSQSSSTAEVQQPIGSRTRAGWAGWPNGTPCSRSTALLGGSARTTALERARTGPSRAVARSMRSANGLSSRPPRRSRRRLPPCGRPVRPRAPAPAGRPPARRRASARRGRCRPPRARRG